MTDKLQSLINLCQSNLPEKSISVKILPENHLVAEGDLEDAYQWCTDSQGRFIVQMEHYFLWQPEVTSSNLLVSCNPLMRDGLAGVYLRPGAIPKFRKVVLNRN